LPASVVGSYYTKAAYGSSGHERIINILTVLLVYYSDVVIIIISNGKSQWCTGVAIRSHWI